MTLFLSDEDNLDQVLDVLNNWCTASGAKFNKEKTEILPIGTQKHRQAMCTLRKLNCEETAPINNKIRIVED
jgi:hypothetical protein